MFKIKTEYSFGKSTVRKIKKNWSVLQ